MRLDVRRPSLTRRLLRSQPTQIFLDAAFGDIDPDFGQLAADAFRAPQPVVYCHAPDQIDCGLWQARTHRSRSGLPPPEQLEAFAMPAQQRLGFDDQNRLPPVAQPAGPEPLFQPVAQRSHQMREESPDSQHLHVVAGSDDGLCWPYMTTFPPG